MTSRTSHFLSIAFAVGATTLAVERQAPAPATGVPGDWPTTAANAQRDGWLRGDPYISKESLATGGFALQWKLTLPASRADARITGWGAMGGRKPIAFLADDAGMVLTIDGDTGFDYWQRTFEAVTTPTAGCRGGVTSGAVRTMALLPATIGANRGGGFGPAVRPAFHGLIGEPGQGIAAELMAPSTPTVAAPVASPAPPAGSVPSSGSAPSGRGSDAAAGRSASAPSGRGGRGGPQGLFVVSPDGVMHTLGENSGLDVQKPTTFLPAGAQGQGLSIVEGVAYLLTSSGCGGVSNGVRALPLTGETRTVAVWESKGAPIGVPAFGTDGSVYVTIGGSDAPDGQANAVVALEPRTLRVLRWFTPPSGLLVTSPMVVRHKERDVVAVALDEGRVVVLDAASLGGADHRTALATAAFPDPTMVPRGLASYADESGTRSLLVTVSAAPSAGVKSAAGALIALTLGNDDALQRRWTVPDLIAPLPPVVVNGVVFALSSGRPGGPPPVLHALDPATGQRIWDSGRAIAGWVQDGTLMAGNSQLYVATTDRVVYAFGFPMDR